MVSTAVRGGDAGVVEQQMHIAELAESAIGEALHLLALGDIHDLGDRRRAGGSHLRGRRIERIALHIGEHEVHAQLAADARELAAEAAARAA